MRKLLTFIIVAATLWGGYWFIGSSAVERGLGMWLSDREAEGWIADYSSLNTSGFPNRFDTTISDLNLADPRSGIAWQAPFFQILALSYKPNHIIAVWPHDQTFATPYERIAIHSEKMQGSITFEPDTSLAIESSRIFFDDLVLTSSENWKTAVESGSFYTRQTLEIPFSHDIGLTAKNVSPSQKLLTQLDPTELLPRVFDTLNIDTTIGFTAPWNRFSVEKERPQITSVELKLIQAKWGDLNLHIAGAFTVDDQGTPDGEIAIKAENWREMLKIGVAAGFVPSAFERTIQSALELLSATSGNPKTLDVPLSFRRGYMMLGPIPLGPAPKIILR